MKIRLIGFIFGLLMLSTNVNALTLQQAKQQGLVGETLSGYIAAVTPTEQAQALVDSINQARKDEYQRIAAQNHVSVNDVAKMAGQKLINRAAPGEYVKGINGQWLKR